jgi:coenzyme F420-dependent glucose-6-phosphate dehydrogenase
LRNDIKMVKISIQAAHEQVNPIDLLNDAIVMDENGIERCWSSDHYMPWWHSGGSGAAAWPWMGSALAKTNNLVIGTGVTAPILRYNPAVVAQVFATLGYMFPNRVFLGLGMGESLNEVPTGNMWPSSSERFKRLKEAVQIIKKLWTEEWVSFKGEYYWIKDSNLYTKPNKPIPLYISAMSPQTAKFAGKEGDGLITNELNTESLRNILLPKFKEGAIKSGKDYDKLEKILFIPASYDDDKEKAIQSIRFWRGAMIKAFFDVDVHDPRQIEDNGQVIGDDTLEKMLLIITNAEEGISRLRKYVNLGFTEIVLTNSSPQREGLVKLISKEIAPALK